MIADDFSDIAARLKQIEQKTEPLASDDWRDMSPDESVFRRQMALLEKETSNVEFVQ